MKRAIWMAVLLGLTLAGCGMSPKGDNDGDVVRFSGSGQPYWPVWLDDGLYFAVAPLHGDGPDELWRWRDGRAAAEPVAVQAADCRSALLRPERRPGGELAVAAGCFEADELRVRLLAVDRVTGATSALVGPPGLDVVWSGQTAYESVATGPCAGVVRVVGERVEAMETGPSFDGRPWPSSRWSVQGTTACPDTGRVRFPVTLDDPAQIAALATDDTGDAAEWTLYLAPAGLTGAATAVVGGFSNVGRVSATPDGSLFLIQAAHDDTEGLWMVDVAARAARLVRAGKFAGAGLSPDGRRVAAVDYHNGLRRITVFPA
ncbi:hypothetical protein [Dactylosporangium sp. CA-233914]|uniref:hypothetical protein n=1 Tax=Dactylosporangium sp. CA-233914 TaxID=3239934 RepID=UPI003D922E0E